MKLGRASLALVAVAVLVGTLSWLPSASTPPVPTGSWVSAPGGMAAARTGASAVQLPDGRVLITGGFSADVDGSSLLASAEVFGANGTFAAVSPMAVARARHASVVLQDGRVLVAGGVLADGTDSDTAEIYDPAADRWDSAGSMGEARSAHTASLLADGRVLIAGGSSLEIYDPVSDAFSFGGGLIPGRRDHAAAVLQDGRVVLAGGASDQGALSSVDVYEPGVGLIPVGNLSVARAALSATALLDGGVLLAGGRNDTGDLASAEAYYPQFGAFTAAMPLQAARSGHQAFPLPHNNSVLLVGGTSGGVALAGAELYLPWREESRGTGSLAVARAGAVGGALAQDGLSLVAGGSNGGGHQASAEVYGFATLKTDKDDYAPGETVTITGGGWQPGETVQMLLYEAPQEHSDRTLTAVADAAGNIVNTEFVPERHHIGVRFYLTAIGIASEAQVTFTDAPKVGSVTIGPQSPNPVIAGNSATYTITVNRGSGGGSSGAFTADLSVTTLLPTGAQAAFSPNPVSFTPSDSGKAATLTITTPGAASPGSTAFTVKAATSASDFAEQSGALVIAAACVAPSITTQPAGQTITYGADATFTAAAAGDPAPTVQWEVSTDNGSNWTGLSGETSTTLTLSKPDVAMSGNRYRAVFTSNCDSTKTTPTNSATLTVTPAAVTATAGSGSGTYNGAAQSPPACEVTGAYTGDLTCVNDPASVGPGVGTFPIAPVLGGTGLDNFDVTSVNGSYTIEQKQATATATAGGGVYNGTAFAGTGTCSDDLSPVIAYSPGPGAPVNAGTTSFTVTCGDGNVNYIDGVDSAAIVITPAPVTATAGSGSGTYNGATQSPAACAVTGDYTGDLTCVNDPASVGPDVGTFPIAPDVSGTGLGNFEITPMNGSYTIDKAPVTATAGSGSAIYDGSAKTPSACAVTGTYTGDLTCANNPASVGPDAGTYSIAPAVSGTGLNNFDITPVNGSYTISKALVTATGGSGSAIYDGSAKTPSACAVTGTYTGDLTCANNPASVGPNAATYVIVPVVSGTGLVNFDITLVNGSYTISPWHLTGFYQPVGVVNSIVVAPGGAAPIANLSTPWHAIKGGNTVPLKFNVFTAEGGTQLVTTTVAITGFNAWRLGSCSGGGTDEEIDSTELSTGGTVLRYSDGQFIQNWQTPKATGADVCYRATVTTKDGSTIHAFFKVRK